jgi:hypothetical protein
MLKYVKGKDKFKVSLIFLNKIWDVPRKYDETKPKVDAKFEGYKKPGGEVKIFDEPKRVVAKPKIDAKIENYERPGGNVKVSFMFIILSHNLGK